MRGYQTTELYCLAWLLQSIVNACLLTHSMQQSPSFEANPFSTSQIPRIVWNPKFITAFTSARHLSLSWASSIQSMPPHPTSWRSILILSSHLRLGLPSGLFPSVFPTKTLHTPLLSPIRATCPAHLILLDFINRKIFGEQYRSLCSSLCSFLHSSVTYILLLLLLLLLLLCFMQHSPSWQANSSLASQKIPRILCNSKVESSLPHLQQPDTCPYPEPINPVHFQRPISWRSISILSSHLRLGPPSRLFPWSSPTKCCMHPTHLSYTCNIPRPSHSSWFYQPNDTWWAVHIIKTLIIVIIIIIIIITFSLWTHFLLTYSRGQKSEALPASARSRTVSRDLCLTKNAWLTETDLWLPMRCPLGNQVCVTRLEPVLEMPCWLVWWRSCPSRRLASASTLSASPPPQTRPPRHNAPAATCLQQGTKPLVSVTWYRINLFDKSSLFPYHHYRCRCPKPADCTL